MRELTIHDLDTELAEQLPARELMGSSCGCRSSSFTYNHDSGNSNWQLGLVNVNNVASGNNIYVG
jgi:hypothetical protein